MSERYDVIIIGTGAGGGTLLHALAGSGLRILVLERGGFLPREAQNHDEHAVFVKGRYLADDAWLDAEGREFRPYTHYWVGGNTKVYGAALLRLRESDFDEVVHHGGVSPAWPIGYDEMEPYYTRAERLFSVHGEAGVDPCEPRRSAPYPHPPVPMEPRMAELCEAFRSRGLRPFPCALGVRLRAGETRPSSRFDGYPDPTGSKADSEVVCVAAAARRPNVTLVTGAKAERLEASASGREIRAVVVNRNGGTERYEADLFVVACGAVNSAALLLRSATLAHPRGLGNSSGQVGRNYMRHQNGLLIALTDEPHDSPFQKAFALTDFYRGDAGWPYPMGTVQLMGKPDSEYLSSLVGDRLPGVPREEIGRHTIDFFLTAEDLPDSGNRVTLAEDGRIRLECRDTNGEAYGRLLARFTRHLDAAMGAKSGRTTGRFHAHRRLGVEGVSHQCGTLRMGNDAATSVVDRDCKAHDLDNLYVADSAVFPSSGAVNPSLTIMANALRVGDRILERLGRAAAQAPAARGRALPA